MGQEHHDEDRALADRLVNYADAAVALSVVGISGLGIAVADPETRSSVARLIVIWISVAQAVVLMLMIR